MSEQYDYLLNPSFDDRAVSDIPSLQSLLDNLSVTETETETSIISDMFEDDEADVMIADRLGITMQDVIDKGVSVGLSPLNIIDNLDVLRAALALREVTRGRLNSKNLTQIYQASVNNNRKVMQTILDNNNITLGYDVSVSDILSLSQAANNGIFKSVYLN